MDETLNIIIKAFSHLDIVLQKKVGPYRIDLYFPFYHISVECDERGHNGYSQQAERVREKYICEKLECIFIRFNPDAPDFNIGNVINQIMRKVY